MLEARVAILRDHHLRRDHPDRPRMRVEDERRSVTVPTPGMIWGAWLTLASCAIRETRQRMSAQELADRLGMSRSRVYAVLASADNIRVR